MTTPSASAARFISDGEASLPEPMTGPSARGTSAQSEATSGHSTSDLAALNGPVVHDVDRNARVFAGSGGSAHHETVRSVPPSRNATLHGAQPDPITPSRHAAGQAGRIICAGLGPGDPELMSVRADRLIRNARHVAYFRKAGRSGQARRIVEGMLAPDVVEYPMEYPLTTEVPVESEVYRATLAAFYDHWTHRLAELARTEEVVVLCEGDPFFYGSFMHLHARLQGCVPVEVIPGIPGMSGCWHATGIPITWGDDVLTVLTGTMDERALTQHMRSADALVVMKTGRNLPKIRRALAAVDRLEAAWLVERGTMSGQRVLRLAEAGEDDCPYFAIVIVHGHGRRPERCP